MTRDNRQILVNPHSSSVKVPTGALNLGEIAVQHPNVEDAALYVETVADSQSAETVAKFISEVAINNLIDEAKNDLQIKIDAINESVGLPHTGTTGDTHHWDENTTVWDAIEETYAEMAAGTAAANTKVEKAGNPDSTKFMTLNHVTDQETSSITYTIGLEGITDAIDAAWNSAHTEIQELSAATKDILGSLDFTGFTDNKQPVVNVTQEDGLVNAELGRIDSEFIDYDSARTLDEVIQEIIEKVNANEVDSEDGTIVVDASGEKTDLSVNIDGETLVKDNDGVISTNLELVALTAQEIEDLPDSANIKDAYKLIYATDNDRVKIGEVVKVYKDSSLKKAEFVDEGESGETGQFLKLTYITADGGEEVVYVNMSELVAETEFKDGLVVNSAGEVRVLVDPASEKVKINSGETAAVLSVSENGVKVSNIQAAIDYAVEELAGKIDSTVTGESSDGHIKVEVVQENTELASVSVTGTDIASKEVLDTVIESVGLGTDGEFVADASGKYISAATDVRNEIKLLDQALNEVSEKLDSASVEEGTSTENFVNLEVTNDGNGATAITINDNQLKTTIDGINEALSAETIAREAADAELLGTSASTTAETSIWGIKNLLEQLNGKAVQNAEFAVLTDSERNTAHCNAGIKVVDNDDEGKKVQLDLSLLKVDCGEY